MNAFDRLPNGQVLLGSVFGATAKAGLALDSVYTYASTGAAYGCLWNAPVSGNLTDVWFFVTAIAGTPGVLTCQLRNWNTSASSKPGTTLHASQTVSPGTTINKWIKFTFATPFSVVQGTPYWLVFGDAGWTSGNTVTIGYQSSIPRDTNRNKFSTGYTTTDGFATNGVASTYTPPLVMKFANGSVFGCPFTNSASYSLNTLERGLKILGLTEDVVVNGLIFSPAVTMSELKIYAGNTAPGGTPVFSTTFISGVSNLGLTYFAPFTLLKNTIYRAVLAYASGATTPQYLWIEDYATGGADLTNAGYDGGSMFGTIDNGAGGWTDHVDRLPLMAFVVQDQSSIQHPASPFKGVFG